MDRLSRMSSRIAPTARRLGELVMRSGLEFSHDRCTSFAAAMSYYVLFSIFPLLLLAVAVAGLVISDRSVTNELVDQVTSVLVVSEEGKSDIENQLNQAVDGVGAIGLLGLVGLVWSSAAMMTALRAGLDVAWDVTTRRPFVLGKLVDLLIVLVLSGLFLSSIALTVAKGEVLDALGTVHPLISLAASTLLPVVVSFIVFLALYRFLPAVRTRFRDIWIGALVAAVLFELAKSGLAFYFSNFGNYSVVYGSLGAVISFLFFVWVVSNIVLYGAEMASEWPRVRAGYYDAERERNGPGPPFAKRLVSALTFRRQEDARRPDPEAPEREEARKP